MRAFRLLDDDAVRHVLCFLRRDRLGNETLPSLIFEARVWRRLGKRFLRLSRDTPSKFDARVAYTKDGVLPRTFSGGHDCGMVSLYDRPQAHLFFLRAPHTGRVWSVCTVSAFVGPPQTLAHNEVALVHNEVKLVHTVLAFKPLLQLLSGHNADFDTRLDHFDKIVAGLEVKITSYDYDKNQQSVNGLVVPPMNRSSWDAAGIDCMVKWDKPPTLDRLTDCLRIELTGFRYAAVIDAAPSRGALRNDNERYPRLPTVSILLGFYDRPDVAECGGMQVSLYNHGLPKELLPKPKANDPELHLRILGRAALDRAERVKSEQRALVVQTARRSLQLAGPSGAPSRRPRNAAIDARDGIRTAAQSDNDTLTTGRLKLIKQMADEESREAEANGYVDDQYAGLGEEKDEPLLYDSDGAYDDAEPKRSKRAMTKERRAEVLAAEARKAREWMIPSDYEDDDDDNDI